MRKWICLIFLFLCFNYPVQAAGKKEVPILLYHSIAEYTGHGLKGLYVTPQKFEDQVRYLKEQGYTLLTFENWEERDKVKKPVFLTFDDGYKNNENVYPIFQKLKDKNFHPTATLFIISDFIGRQNRLSEIDLKRLAQTGFFSIQSHTATHPDLTKTKNYQYQLGVSKEKIEKVTGKPVIALSYPFGIFNQEVITQTKKYYLFGLADNNKNSEIENDKYQLPRKYIYYSTTMEEFKKIVEAGN